MLFPVAILLCFAFVSFIGLDLLLKQPSATMMISTRTSFKMESNSTKVEREVPVLIDAKLEQSDLIYGPVPKRNTVPIVNEEYNVIFFQVAKAASTEWKRFFARLEDNPQWCTGQKGIHKREINRLKLLSDYSIDKAERMMKSQKWKKVVFVRHPKPRLLSAFLDKAVVNSEHFLKHYCDSYAKNANGTSEASSLDECRMSHQDFSFFLKNFTAVPVVKDNMHWRTIYSRIDAKWWPYIDFIGKMENLNDDAKQFLSSIHSNVDGVSAWDRIGTSGWSNKYSKNCTKASQSEGQFFGVRDPGHSTNAKDQMMKYYNTELEELIEERYADDIENPYFKHDQLKLYIK